MNFGGRASRSDYWWVVLTNFLIGFIFCIIALAVLYSSAASGLQQSLSEEKLGFHIITSLLPFWLISTIWGLVNLLPALAISVCRLRDAGYHWAFVLLGYLPGLLLVIPILNILAFLAILPCGIALIVLLAMPTKEQPIGTGYPNGGYSGVNPQAPGFQGQAQNFGQATNFSGVNAQQSAPSFQGQPQSFGQAGQPTDFKAQQPASVFQEQANQSQSFGQATQPSQEQAIPTAVFGDANSQVAQEPTVQEAVSQEQPVQQEAIQSQNAEDAPAEATAIESSESDKQE